MNRNGSTKLIYPVAAADVPAFGQPQQIVDGVFWLKLELPYALDHINVWLLEEEDSWTLVDTGLYADSSLASWHELRAGFLSAKPIKRIICTHMHPDHAGCAGWLCEQFHAELCMTKEEYQHCRMLVANTGKSAPPEAISYYKQAGFDDQQLAHYERVFGYFGKRISPLPEAYRCLEDQELLLINGRKWQVVVGSGHSPEHACLFCPELKILISGDQVLPRISSNVSLWPENPCANPLFDWLASCQKLSKLLPDDVLVLPAHQEPFYGLHCRLKQIQQSHENALAELQDQLEEPRSAVECMSIMYKRDMEPIILQLAIGETLAHLRYLEELGSLVCSTDADGIHRFQMAADSF